MKSNNIGPTTLWLFGHNRFISQVLKGAHHSVMLLCITNRMFANGIVSSRTIPALTEAISRWKDGNWIQLVTIGDFSSAKDVKSQNRSYKITQTPSIAISTIKATEAMQRLLHFEVELLELSDINRICTRVRREMLENHGRSVFIHTIVNLFVVEWEKHGERLDSIQSFYQPTCGGHPMPDLEDHTIHTTCQWGPTGDQPTTGTENLSLQITIAIQLPYQHVNSLTHRIHGAGIYANIKGVYWW